MSSSDGEGPGQKPKPPASSTLAGMPPPKDAPPVPPKAPLPPPKAPPGGRSHSPSTLPPLRRDPAGGVPPSGPHAVPPSGPHAVPSSGPHVMPAAPTPAPAAPTPTPTSDLYAAPGQPP